MMKACLLLLALGAATACTPTFFSDHQGIGHRHLLAVSLQALVVRCNARAELSCTGGAMRHAQLPSLSLCRRAQLPGATTGELRLCETAMERLGTSGCRMINLTRMRRLPRAPCSNGADWPGVCGTGKIQSPIAFSTHSEWARQARTGPGHAAARGGWGKGAVVGMRACRAPGQGVACASPPPLHPAELHAAFPAKARAKLDMGTAKGVKVSPRLPARQCLAGPCAAPAPRQR